MSTTTSSSGTQPTTEPSASTTQSKTESVSASSETPQAKIKAPVTTAKKSSGSSNTDTDTETSGSEHSTEPTSTGPTTTGTASETPTSGTTTSGEETTTESESDDKPVNGTKPKAGKTNNGKGKTDTKGARGANKKTDLGDTFYFGSKVFGGKVWKRRDFAISNNVLYIGKPNGKITKHINLKGSKIRKGKEKDNFVIQITDRNKVHKLRFVRVDAGKKFVAKLQKVTYGRVHRKRGVSKNDGPAKKVDKKVPVRKPTDEDTTETPETDSGSVPTDKKPESTPTTTTTGTETATATDSETASGTGTDTDSISEPEKIIEKANKQDISSGTATSTETGTKSSEKQVSGSTTTSSSD